jgi:hypothetical protein
MDCPPAGRKLSATAQSSLLATLSAYLPGFRLSLPQPRATLQCVQQYVSARDAARARGVPAARVTQRWCAGTPRQPRHRQRACLCRSLPRVVCGAW